MTVHEKAPICPMRTSLRLDNNADTKMLNDLNLRNSTIRSLGSVFTVGVEPMAGRIVSKSTMPKGKGKPSAAWDVELQLWTKVVTVISGNQLNMYV